MPHRTIEFVWSSGDDAVNNFDTKRDSRGICMQQRMRLLLPAPLLGIRLSHRRRQRTLEKGKGAEATAPQATSRADCGSTQGSANTMRRYEQYRQYRYDKFAASRRKTGSHDRKGAARSEKVRCEVQVWFRQTHENFTQGLSSQ